MAKFKQKKKPVWLKCKDGDKYCFKNGVAKVKNMRINRMPVTITIKEFRELNSDKNYTKPISI